MILASVAPPLLGICPLLHPKGSCPAVRPPECDMDYNDQQGMARTARDDLLRQGWLAREGLLRFTSGHMYGQNPQSRYGLFEFNDTLIEDMPLWTLGPADAIFWIGCTPPPLEYFSMRSYVWLSNGTNLFASLGDAANNLRFNSTGGPTSPGNINRTASMIVSGDLRSGATVASALRSAGFPAGAIKHDWMPPALLHMRRSQWTTIDEAYMLLYRVSLFEDKEQEARYVNSSWPVYMMWAPWDAPTEPAPVPVQRARGTGTSERALVPSVDALVRLANATMASARYALAQTVRLSPIDIEGVLDCIPHARQCGGDNRDAAYLSDRVATYTLPDDASFLLVVGANHNASGKATYGNVVVETLPKPDTGVFNLTDNGQFGADSRAFEGTAVAFARGEPLPTDKLFAAAIARNCSALADVLRPALAPHGELRLCLELPEKLRAQRNPPLLRVVTRAHLESETQTGPAYDELAWPHVLHFRREGTA